jgi:hypothetical protein
MAIVIDEFLKKAIRDDLMAAVLQVPQTWPTWTKQITMTSENDTLAWPGDLPQPRVMVDGRLTQSIEGYQYDVTTDTHELTLLFDQQFLEDEQIDAMQPRISQLGRSWGTYWQRLAIQKLITPGNTWDGTDLYDDSRTVGASGAIDNKQTLEAATGTVPTSSEFLNALQLCRGTFATFKSDKGQPNVTLNAVENMHVLAPFTYHRAILEALHATELAATTNVYAAEAGTVEFSPYITSADLMYVIANGDPDRKPLIWLDRTPFQILIYSDPFWVDYNGGLLVAMRQRGRFIPNDFYSIIQFTWG